MTVRRDLMHGRQEIWMMNALRNLGYSYNYENLGRLNIRKLGITVKGLKPCN